MSEAAMSAYGEEALIVVGRHRGAPMVAVRWLTQKRMYARRTRSPTSREDLSLF